MGRIWEDQRHWADSLASCFGDGSSSARKRSSGSGCGGSVVSLFRANSNGLWQDGRGTTLVALMPYPLTPILSS